VLKDHGRASVIGQRSAGAVLASWYYVLPDGGELQLSREDYLAPKGRRLEGNGVEPDVTTRRTLADLRAGRDPDVEAALKIFRGS
jgi:carboxyl-terminal processing protease